MKQIVVLDFGSQYTQLISRRLRENGVYSEILPYHAKLSEIISKNPSGIILSGGPASVHVKNSPRPDPGIYDANLPILGICYGMQLLALESGGKVLPSKTREYGFARVSAASNILFKGMPRELKVWMSHGDGVKSAGKDFEVIASTRGAPYAAICGPAKNWYGVQFHPEVVHTDCGGILLENFARRICNHRENWTPGKLLSEGIGRIKALARDKKVICGLSGGVDSSVAAVMVSRAIGKNLKCIFVDTGLLRSGDRERVEKVLVRKLGLDVKTVDASKLFVSRLKGVSNPERKRKIIGNTFIEVFEKEARRIKGVRFLVQGTLYPDVIESVSVVGPSATIKSHHNVGGLPEKMNMELIEPLRFLFKDEVRLLGRELGIPKEILEVHPFPGPGLAIRILGEVTPQKLEIVRRADKILHEEMRLSGMDRVAWQFFVALLPVRSVGVMGDERTYEHTAVVRAVNSVDGMTADWTRIPHETLQKISGRIVSEVRGINRIVYDITSKPPATIEWE